MLLSPSSQIKSAKPRGHGHARAHSSLLPSCLPVHRHAQDWQQQSYLCQLSAEPGHIWTTPTFRIYSLQVNFLISNRYGSTTIYLLRQEYSFNLYFTRWLLSDWLVGTEYLCNQFSVLKLPTMLSRTFHNYFKTNTTTQANKQQNQRRPKSSSNTKTCNTSCYYLSSLKMC